MVAVARPWGSLLRPPLSADTVAGQPMDADFFRHVHDLWIEPELARRRQRGTLTSDFKICRALVCLPRDRQPSVTFNDEIAWAMRVDMPEKDGLRLGDPIYWDQVRRVETVEPPQVAGSRVAFVYLFKVTKGYQTIFDFSPNLADADRATIEIPDWHTTLGPAIAATLQAGLVERSVNIDELLRTQLRTVGLWPAPALVPYPFQDIMRRMSEGDMAGARKTLVKYCTPSMLHKLADAWWDAPEFARRKALLSEALAAHQEARYVLSIPALLPQLEGVVTDWMLRCLPAAAVPFRQESKTKKFRDTLLQAPDKAFAYEKVVEATISFVLDGPVLASFKEWGDAVDDAFPNRHVVEHGRHDDAIYTEESSLKLVLLLDTIHFLMTDRAF